MTNPLTPMADIANMAHVMRWNAFHVSRSQTLAEHTALVTMYALRILQMVNPEHSDLDAKNLLIYCLFHDLPEAALGDTPTPTKRWLEAKYPEGESPLDELERMVCPEHAIYQQKVKGTYLANIAKLADILDAMHFIGIEGKGPRADVVFNGRMRVYDDLVAKSEADYPDLDWAKAKDIKVELLHGQCTEIEFTEGFLKNG